MTEATTETTVTKTEAVTDKQPDKTFTQAEVDQIVLKRAERVAADKYADYGDLKAKATKLDELEQANASELEKATARARKEGADEARGAGNARLVAAEARALAAEAKFRNPTLAIRSIDLSGVTVGDGGDIDAAAIRSLLADLAKDEPYLVDDGKPAKPKPDDTQGRQPGSGINIAEASNRELLRDAYTTH